MDFSLSLEGLRETYVSRAGSELRLAAGLDIVVLRALAVETPFPLAALHLAVQAS